MAKYDETMTLQQVLDDADKMGYSPDICSYARINIAYAEMETDEIPGLPKPNFVVCTNNICNVLVKWYESLARQFDVPFFLIDVPFNYESTGVDKETIRFTGLLPQNRLDYIKAQFGEFIAFLEKICGKKFDEEKFKKIRPRKGVSHLLGASVRAPATIKNNLKKVRILGIFATNGTNRHERIGKFREFVRVVGGKISSTVY